MVDIVPVIIKNRDGLSLYGMMHIPKDSSLRKKTAVILLSPGIKSHIGPHRLYVNMAASYAKEGYVVLRFDFHGLGDSEGDVEGTFVADIYGSIEQGRYVHDVDAAMAYLEKEQGIGRFVLGGLCGGAMTGLIAGSGDSRVVGLIGLGIPVTNASNQVNQSKYMTEGQAASLRTSYFEKIRDVSAWKRFFSFESDYRAIWRILFRKAPPSSTQLTAISTAPDGSIKHPEGNSVNESNVNMLFPQAFHKMVFSSRKLLLIFSEMDRLYWEFEEKFWQPYKQIYRNKLNLIDVRILKNANHIISFPDSQKEMLGWTCGWLRENYN